MAGKRLDPHADPCLTLKPMKVDGNRFRRKRFGTFLSVVDRAGVSGRPVRILDIGGTASYWKAFEPLWEGRAFDITIINLGVEPSDDGIYHLRPGNACSMPEYADGSFDVVHSNSVIEHVGRWPEMVAMAGEVRRIAPHYYLQTPNFWFPIEPHFRSALIHWLPEQTRAAMLMGRKRGFRSAASFDEAIRQVQDINLLTMRQMAELFPDAELERERFAGIFTKSLIAKR